MDEIIANIGPNQCRQRLYSGFIALAISFIAFGLFIYFDINRVYRLVLFLPLMIAMLGFYQARNHTCVLLAAIHARNMDGGNQAITDPALDAKIRHQAEKVYFQSSIVSAIITSIWMVIF